MSILTEAGGQLLDEAGGQLLTESFPGYPDADLDAMTELNLGGTWTDITQWAMPDGSQYGSITSGQPDGSQQVQPASMSAMWDNADGRFSIRNTSGPYYGQLRQNILARVSVASVWGTYLRLEGDGGDYAYTADGTPLHITGSLEVRIELMRSDWGPCVLGARYGASGTPSWLWGMQDDGTLLFTWYDSGATQHTAVSTASVPYAPGAMALRVTLSTSAGAVAFYTSDGIDGTWTQLGSTVTGSATSVAAGDQPLTVGYSAYGGVLGQLYGDVYGFRLYNGIGGTVVADAGFSSQPDSTTSWTDGAGLTWDLSGAAEISGRDYRLHAELSSIAPTVAVSGSQAKAQATLSGRLRRMQQGQAQPVLSPMTRALLAASGDLACVALWPCEDPAGSPSLASAIPGVPALSFATANLPALADSSPFGAATLPLPQVDSSAWTATIPSYTSGGAIVVRFAADIGTATLPTDETYGLPLVAIGNTGTVPLVTMVLQTGAGTVGLIGYNGSTQEFNSGIVGPEGTPNTAAAPLYWSMECTASGGTVTWKLICMGPGEAAQTVYTHSYSGTVGDITAIYVNGGNDALTDTILGMISVQSAWEPITDYAGPLGAYAGELAATRFRRVCSDESIGCRIIGPDAGSAAMGPQPAATVLAILQDCALADGGLMFEPRTALGAGLRTKASMLAQPAAVTLSFTTANLPGSFQLLDDDQIVINDVTASNGVTDTGGVTLAEMQGVRYTLDDGSPKSISEPPVGVGTYATTVTLNVATETALATAAEWYVAARTPDAARASGLTADFGTPGAPVTDIARLRPGDLVVVQDPPDTYQSADIEQLQQGATETFGPGRQIAWDCIPALPWA
jgi:hypothetical protein